jgi:hypothetical protein
MIQTTCPKCSASFQSPDSLAGKKETCPECGNEFIIPEQYTIPGFGVAPNEKLINMVPAPKSGPRQPGDGTKLTACIMMTIGVITIVFSSGQRAQGAITGPICGTVILVGGILLLALGNILAAISKPKQKG